MPARSGDCTSVRKRASRSCSPAVAPRGRAPGGKGQVVHGNSIYRLPECPGLPLSYQAACPFRYTLVLL